MSTKNIYLFKIVIRDTISNTIVPVCSFKPLFQEIFDREKHNNAIKLNENINPIILDILEDNDEYLFARLNCKRPNNSMQKRNYNTYETTDVLSPNEIGNNGVEWFTYCILGYSHGILSIVNSKGAPNEGALARIFSRYNNKYLLESEPIPNSNLLNELIHGQAPEINKIQIDISQPDAQILNEIFGFNDKEVLHEVSENTSSIVFEVKPAFRSALSTDPSKISQIIDILLKNKHRYNSVILSGKPTTGERQRQYDLYEEYFKYPISINEYRYESGQKIEREKAEILHEYKISMMNVYNEYKDIILKVSNR